MATVLVLRDAGPSARVVRAERDHRVELPPPRELGAHERQALDDRVTGTASESDGESEQVDAGVGCREPAPGGAREARVLHRPVPAVGEQVGRRVVAVLGEQVATARRTADRMHAASDEAAVVLDAAPPGHVRRIDAPSVERVRRGEVAGGDRSVAVVQAPPELRIGVVELRERRHPRP
jgi:hypothetical protein